MTKFTVGCNIVIAAAFSIAIAIVTVIASGKTMLTTASWWNLLCLAASGTSPHVARQTDHHHPSFATLTSNCQCQVQATLTIIILPLQHWHWIACVMYKSGTSQTGHHHPSFAKLPLNCQVSGTSHTDHHHPSFATLTLNCQLHCHCHCQVQVLLVPSGHGVFQNWYKTAIVIASVIFNANTLSFLLFSS